MAPDKNTTASKPKEIKSSSVPGTPQSNQKHKRTSSSSEALEKNIHSSNTTTVVTSQEKHVPNYLRPTISSVKSSSKNQSESSTLPSVTNRRSVNKHLPLPRKLPNPTLPRSPRSSTARTQVHRKPVVHKGLSKGTKKQQGGGSKSVQNKNTGHEDEEKEVCTDNDSKINDEKCEEQMFHYDASEESLGGGDEMTSDDGSSVRSRMTTENESKKVECEEENKEVKEVGPDKEVVNNNCEDKNKADEAGTDVKDHVMDVESNEPDNASETVTDKECEEKKEKVEHVATAVKNSNVEEKERLNANNAVIEETASKLAEKKNKVLALAGAFETVMSLQEPKGQPSPKKVHEDQHKDERKESIVKNDQEIKQDEANMHEDADDKVEEEIDVNKQRCQEEEGNSNGEETELKEEKSNEMKMSRDEENNDAEEMDSASAETKEGNTKENESA